jgi:HTH-type transcriptional regulator/antitoxin HigA
LQLTHFLYYDIIFYMNNTNFRTPGQLIESLLAERGWTQRVLAIILDVDVAVINRLVSDKRPVGADMAILLGEVFSVDADNFLELQKNFDLAKAKIVARPDPGRATRAHLFGGLPIAEMIKRGWLAADDVRKVPQVEQALVKFFGVNSSTCGQKDKYFYACYTCTTSMALSSEADCK